MQQKEENWSYRFANTASEQTDKQNAYNSCSLAHTHTDRVIPGTKKRKETENAN